MKAVLLAIFCLLIAPLAAAAFEHVTASQAADGSVLITLTGMTSCGVPSVSNTSVVGSNVTITSDFANPGPPCGPGPLVPYSVTANLGHVPDGTYSVVWSFVLTPPGTSAFATFSGQFTLSGGILLGPLAVPTMGWPGYMALAALILLFSMRRRKPLARTT